MAFPHTRAPTWKLVDPAKTLAGWRPGDGVTIEPDPSAKHLYQVVNRSRHGDLEADFLGFS